MFILVIILDICTHIIIYIIVFAVVYKQANDIIREDLTVPIHFSSSHHTTK